jgi:ankyrin repeat protein
MVAYLLKKGANVDARIGANGDNPVDIAEKQGSKEVELLFL